MDIIIQPRLLRGQIDIIPSKSQAHRLLICAAFADRPTELRCPQTNRDIEATVDCLQALGAKIRRTETGYTVFPVEQAPEAAVTLELDLTELWHHDGMRVVDWDNEQLAE